MTDEVDEPIDELSEDIILEENDEIDQMKILEEQIEELQKEKIYDTAEIANIRQRYARERNILVKFAGMNLAFNILPVVDNLEKVLDIKNNDSEKFIEGMNLTLKMLKTTFENEGIVKIEALDKEFNPSFMEAIAVIPAPEDKNPGVVLEIIEDGYMFHDRVLRPVKVVVSEN